MRAFSPSSPETHTHREAMNFKRSRKKKAMPRNMQRVCMLSNNSARLLSSRTVCSELYYLQNFLRNCKNQMKDYLDAQFVELGCVFCGGSPKVVAPSYNPSLLPPEMGCGSPSRQACPNIHNKPPHENTMEHFNYRRCCLQTSLVTVCALW